MSWQTLCAFGAYFFILLMIGIFSHKKSTSEVDFVIGGRSLNFWVTAISAHASDMSSWLFMAFPMAIFVGGLSQAWIAVGLFVGMWFSWQFIAPRLRRATEKYDCYTISSFFEKRFHDTSGTLRFVSAIMTLIFMLNYLSAGLTTMGMIFDSVFGINYLVGISVATAVIALYTIVGGFVTVAWTDMFQGCFLLVVLLFVPALALTHVEGGFGTIGQIASAQNISFSLLPEYSFLAIIQALFLVLGWGLGYFGQLHVMTKFMGIANPAELKKSKWVGMTWQFLALSSAAMVGIVGIGFFSGGMANSEMVFVEMVKMLFNPLVGGFILCAMLAATISTMDSQILVAAGVLTEDIYRLLFRRRPQDKDMLGKSRISVVVISATALAIASSQGSIMETVTYSWTGLGCSFGPLVLMGLYSSTANRYGAISGILVGGIIALTWGMINPLITDFKIPVMIPGFSLATLAIWGVSKMTAAGEAKRLML